MLRDLFSLFPAYVGVILCRLISQEIQQAFPRIRGGDPWTKSPKLVSAVLFPAYAGVIPGLLLAPTRDRAFPCIRGAYQKTPRKVLRERLKKRP